MLISAVPSLKQHGQLHDGSVAVPACMASEYVNTVEGQPVITMIGTGKSTSCVGKLMAELELMYLISGHTV